MNQIQKHKSHTHQWLTGVGAALLFFAIVYAVSIKSTGSKTQVSGLALESEVLNPVESVAYFEDLVRKHPGEAQYKVALAQVYMQQARDTRQEELYLPKAERMLEQALAKLPDHFQALALQASLYNALHQFEEGQQLAQRLIARNPHNAYVYGILIDALVELGLYEEAVEACDRMIELRPGLASYARASYLRELHGDSKGAIEAMRLAADAGVVGSAERTWAIYQLGQLYLGDNDLARAGFIFEGLLEEQPGYAFAIGGLAQIHLVSGRFDEAIEQFDMAYKKVPADEFIEGLAEAYAEVGQSERVQRMWEKLEESYHAADQMGENVQMEYADFLADIDQDLPLALNLAEKEYQRRPGHLHALETYAWALHKADRSSEAIPVIEQAMRLGTGDAMVHYRAARIYEAASMPDVALHHFERSLQENLHIESPSTAGEVLEWLQESQNERIIAQS